MSEENVEIARGIVAAFREGMNQGNWGAVFDLDTVAPEAEWVPVQMPGTAEVYRGQDGFTEFMKAWTEDFEDWSMELDRIGDAGDGRVVCTGRQWATGKGSGVPVEWHFGQIFEFEGGRLVCTRVFADPTAALEAAGFSPGA
jgi:ketosteroid isomerase-like protein